MCDLLRVQKVTQGLPVLLSIRAHVDCRLVAWDGAATVGDRGTVRPVLAGRAAAGRHGTGATLLRTRTAQLWVMPHKISVAWWCAWVGGQCVVVSRACEPVKRNLLLVRAKAQFSYPKILQKFSDSPSHRIFRHMHEALNINKK
jgi:hypothetical protein